VVSLSRTMSGVFIRESDVKGDVYVASVPEGTPFERTEESLNIELLDDLGYDYIMWGSAPS
jgi:hypothetical protein